MWGPVQDEGQTGLGFDDPEFVFRVHVQLIVSGSMFTDEWEGSSKNVRQGFPLSRI